MVETRVLGAAPTALLAALRHQPLTREDLATQLALNARQVVNAARRLTQRGYLTVLEGGAYGLTEAGRLAAENGEVIRGGPKGQVKLLSDTLRARAWRAMRVRKTFTIGDLVSDAVCDEKGRPHDNIARYLSKLGMAGYVSAQPRRRRGTAIGSNGFKVYRLVRNTGPKAPVFRSDVSAIHDPNTGEDVPCVQR